MQLAQSQAQMAAMAVAKEQAQEQAEKAQQAQAQAQQAQALLALEKAQAEALAARLQADRSVPECVICMDAECSILLEPCMHVCCCTGCAAKLGQSPKCPQCRRPVSEKKELIFS